MYNQTPTISWKVNQEQKRKKLTKLYPIIAIGLGVWFVQIWLKLEQNYTVAISVLSFMFLLIASKVLKNYLQDYHVFIEPNGLRITLNHGKEKFYSWNQFKSYHIVKEEWQNLNFFSKKQNSNLPNLSPTKAFKIQKKKNKINI